MFPHKTSVPAYLTLTFSPKSYYYFFSASFRIVPISLSLRVSLPSLFLIVPAGKPYFFFKCTNSTITCLSAYPFSPTPYFLLPCPFPKPHLSFPHTPCFFPVSPPSGLQRFSPLPTSHYLRPF